MTFNGIYPPVNGIQYTNFQCDVRFDPGSATVTVGNVPTFGYLQFGIPIGYNQDYFGGVSIPSSNTNWVHVSLHLNVMSEPNLQNINDVLIHIYGPYYSPGLSGISTLWVDNIKFVGASPVTTNCVVDWNRRASEDRRFWRFLGLGWQLDVQSSGHFLFHQPGRCFLRQSWQPIHQQWRRPFLVAQSYCSASSASANATPTRLKPTLCNGPRPAEPGFGARLGRRQRDLKAQRYL